MTVSPLAGPMWVARMRRDPLGTLASTHARHGSIVPIRIGRKVVTLVAQPAAAHQVLTSPGFAKGLARAPWGLPRRRGAAQGFVPLSLLLGDGLLTSAEPQHRPRRLLVRPLFTRAQVEGYGPTFTALAEQACGRWPDGGTVELHREMTDLTLAIVMRTLFDADLDSAIATTVRTSLTAAMSTVRRATRPWFGLTERLPLPGVRRWHAARDAFDTVVADIVTARRRDGGRGDLLTLLLDARDPETGAGLSDREVRNEVLTLLLAGHETTANTLTWALHLLRSAPLVLAAIQDEVDAAPADLAGYALPRTAAVVEEAMRLYPPAWLIARRAIHDIDLAGQALPAGSCVLISPWVLHRDPQSWTEPDTFDPWRWLAPSAAPRGAYLPFGAGTRQCVGAGFARFEAVHVLATVARRWRLQPPRTALPTPQPLVTLRPLHDPPVIVHRRYRPALAPAPEGRS